MTQSLFVESPTPSPPLVVILYSGGDGTLQLNESGATELRGNFLVRTASYWVAHGYAAVLADAPSDCQRSGMNDYYRRSKDALADQQFIVEQVRKRFPTSKIALIGTSRGTVTVGNVLEHAPDLADLYVLTSPESVATRHPGIADLDVPKGYETRALIVSNEHDACPVSTFYGGKSLASRNKVAFVAEDSNEGGGDMRANCGGHSPHGFLGVEHKTLDDINDWITQNLEAAATAK
ncbi:lysophospholipase [Trinickia dinghuensis]|uniref:lysophospholipase n=1 Tax=Trinickia dinghuensis TaxID=2291023 RepID=UPI001C6A29C4|nr:lysophospholipase [Trinickia dinghuensis]